MPLLQHRQRPHRSRLLEDRNRWIAWGVLLLLLAPVAASSPSSTPAFDYRPIPGGRAAPLTVPAPGQPGFTSLSPTDTGIAFTNAVAESRSLTNHILLNGSGVAAGDIDGDGWCDLYFCGLDGPNALFRNLGGWRFENIAAPAGVDCPQLDATGAVLVDLDGDGDLDLLVSAIRSGVHCYLNDGHGRFQDHTEASGLSARTGSTTVSLADTDGDGDLDLYVANYRNETLRDAFRMQIRVNTIDGRRVVTMVNHRPLNSAELAGWVTLDPQGNITENGQPDFYYHNQGQARFALRRFTDGDFLDPSGNPILTPLFDWTLTAMFRDLNQDSIPDLYVCSDMSSPDRIWLGVGDGRLQAIRPTALRKTSWFSMGVDCGDLNRDGHDEIFVTDMVSLDHRLRQVQVSDHQAVHLPIGATANRPQSPRNTLFLNTGDGDYLEIAYAAGLYATEWSWSPVFLDVDLDGYEDVLIATGFERDVQDIDIANELERMRRDQNLSDEDALQQRARFPRLDLPNLAFRNRGDLTFEEVGTAWGFNTRGVSQGTALADLDNDGDLDVIVNNLNGPAGIYRNNASAPRLAVRLAGLPPNTRGIGARIRVLGGATPQQSQEMQAGGRYLSSDDPVRTFAAGGLTNRLSVEVTWRSGQRTTLNGILPNQTLEITEAATHPAPAPSTVPPPLFEDLTAQLGHRHSEEDYPDFDRQPLLPRKLSQMGPGVAWFDLDGDGWEDLFISAGTGSALGAYQSLGNGRFQRLGQPPFTEITPREQAALLGLFLTPTHRALLAASSAYEHPNHEIAAVHRYSLDNPQLAAFLPPTPSPTSSGALAAADVDGDSDLDLFVAGRVSPGRYPEPAVSRVFRNDAGTWTEDLTAAAVLRDAGMTSAAVWSDLEGDGFPELLLACEWGPLRVYRRTRTGDWSEITASLGLDPYRGWWNGIATGDFNNDGRLDIVASNWGRNHKYQAYRDRPLRLYSGDFAEAGNIDLLEAYFFPPLGDWVPWQHFGRVSQALPALRTRFLTYRQFGSATLPQILADRLPAAQILEATWLDSTLFLNLPGGFVPHPLPHEAQLSPAFALCVTDVNNDGHEDLFLSQNFFATEPETGRYDSGRGLWLAGDGRGHLRVMSARETGIRIYGEQRGAAVCDFDHDGRMDLCVSQNGTATRLFRNTSSPPGIRVRLQGPPHNPLGIGAQMRLTTAGRPSPVREIQAGSGYWSQNAATLVFPQVTEPTPLEIRWPGGIATTHTLPPNTEEVTLPWTTQPQKP